MSIDIKAGLSQGVWTEEVIVVEIEPTLHPASKVGFLPPPRNGINFNFCGIIKMKNKSAPLAKHCLGQLKGNTILNLNSLMKL